MNAKTTVNRWGYAPALLSVNKRAVLWKLFRPHTLTASFIPVAIGTVAAWPYCRIQISLLSAMLLASMLIQAATNMFNEYYDYKRGLDNEHSVGIGGAIVRDGMEPRMVLALALLSIAIASFLGVFLCIKVSWWLMPVGLVCALTGYLYSAGPFPISATPFGEAVSGIFMGYVIIAIAFFLQTGTVTQEVAWLSAPTSVLIGAILLANNIRDLIPDKRHGRRTLAVLIGRKAATSLLLGMFTFAYLWVIGMVFTGMASSWTLLTMASIPRAFHAVQGFRRARAAEALMPAMVATAQTNTMFGLLFTFGLLLPQLLP